MFDGDKARPDADTARPSVRTSLPDSAQGEYNRAAQLWRSDDTSSDPKASLELLGAVVAQAPDYAPARRMRGFTLLQLGEKEEAFEELTRAVRLDPSPAMYASRALVCLRSNTPVAATRDVEYALKLDPDLAFGYAVRGQISRKHGEVKDACSDFSKACSLGNCLALEDAKKDNLCK